MRYRRLALSFDNGNNVLVGELMRKTHTLWLMLDRFPIYDSNTEIVYNGFMDGVTLNKSALTRKKQKQTAGNVSLTKSSTVHLEDLSTTGAV